MVADDSVVFDAVVFCVLQILFCRVLSLPLTLKISQTCSLVYTRQHPKNIHFHGTAAAAGLVSSCPLLAICALSLLPVAFLSDAPTTKLMHGSPARALVTRCDKLRLELARWFTTWFQAGGRRTASRREESLRTRTQ